MHPRPRQLGRPFERLLAGPPPDRDNGWKLDRPALFDQERLLVDALLEPTRIYVKSLLPLVREGKIGALAHITGGGLLENIPRVLPEGAHAVVDADAWPLPRLMAFLQAGGAIEPGEMARTFNCGIGMVAIVAPGRRRRRDRATRGRGRDGSPHRPDRSRASAAAR